MIQLFWSDDELRAEQKRAAYRDKGLQTPTLEQGRAERIENERELREHRRWRQFAVLLFLVPIIVGIVTVSLAWLFVHVAASR